MAFIHKLRTALGFGDEECDEVRDDADPEVPALKGGAEGSATLRGGAPSVESVQPDADMQSRIFAHVVEVFNSSLPEFLKAGINAKAQQHYLRDTLDASVKEYLDGIEATVTARCREQSAGDHQQLRQEVASLTERNRDLDRQRNDIQQKQLSADRQRRALAERVHDLENKVLQLEAEKDQYQLEVKSMVNKLKVVEVQEGDAQGLRDEIDRLNKLVNDLRQSPAGAEMSELKNLEDENGRLNKAMENARAKAKISDAMINQLNNQLTEARRAAEASAEAGKAGAAEIDGLKARLEAAKAENATREKELAALKDDIAHAKEVSADIARLNEQMGRVEEVIARRDKKIQRLTAENATLSNDIETLQRTIKTNLLRAAQREEELNREIARLKAGDDDRPVPQSGLNVDDVADGIDDLEPIDWLVATPPKGAKRTTATHDPEFGYQAPPRKSPPPENDAQMSLF